MDSDSVDFDFDFDIAVSFAGEDRTLVSSVVNHVKDAGYSVFYDEDEQAAIWGEELTEYFPDIHERKARYTVMFISADYAAKPWTRLERRSVLLRAMNQSTTYLLPVRIDQTVLPGVRSSISYLDAKKLGASGIGEAICRKLGAPTPNDTRKFNGLVPRTELEVAALLGERPLAWEYLLFSYALVQEFNALRSRFLDYQVGFAPSADYIRDLEVIDIISREHAQMAGNIRNFMAMLSESSQIRAFGAPGESGDVEAISHLAQRLASTYGYFMDWGMRLRGLVTESDAARELFEALSHFTDQPVHRLNAFPSEFRAHADQFSTMISQGQTIELALELALEISSETNSTFDTALKKFRNHLKD